MTRHCNRRYESFISDAHGPFMAFIPDPVSHFERAWYGLDLASQLQAHGLPGTMLEALEAGLQGNAAVMAILSSVQNSVAKALGFLDEAGQLTEHAVSQLTYTHLFTFSFPELADNDRVLAYFGRVTCWDFDDLAFVSAQAAAPSVPTDVAEAIRRFNFADVAVHEFAVSHFEELVAAEVELDSDIETLQKTRRRLLDECASFAGKQQEELLSMAKPLGSVESTCASLHLSATSFEALLRQERELGAAFSMLERGQ
eukprot:m.743132 g.743132  ORF g.743132 m.743132 type:complete len:256 (+) comp58944_c2_seq81:2619-3386(+)